MSVFDKKANEIYKAVSKEVLEIAKIKNKDRDYSKMEEVLQMKNTVSTIVKTEAGKERRFQ